MPENETLDAAASSTTEEQPALESVTDIEAPASETAPDTDTQEQEPAPLLAGKYKSQEELVKGYQHSTAEASRLAAELAGYKKGIESARSSTAPATPQEFSSEQLRTWKAGYLTSLSDLQVSRREAIRDGDHAAAAKFEQDANKAANQVVLIDDKLREQGNEEHARAGKRQSASQTVDAAARSVLTKYQSQLVEGTPFYTKASELWQHYIDMGQPDNPATQAQALLLAAELTGTKAEGAAQATRKQLTTSIQTALKTGVATGSGKGQAGTAAPDFLGMSDKDFLKYKADKGWT